MYGMVQLWGTMKRKILISVLCGHLSFRPKNKNLNQKKYFWREKVKFDLILEVVHWMGRFVNEIKLVKSFWKNKWTYFLRLFTVLKPWANYLMEKLFGYFTMFANWICHIQLVNIFNMVNSQHLNGFIQTTNQIPFK